MKKILFIFIIAITFGTIKSNAHNSYPDTVICPICGDTVAFHITISMTTIGSYLDFQKKGFTEIYYENLINLCENCYYNGYHKDFNTKFEQDDADKIRNITSKYIGKEIDNSLECEIAAEIYQFRNFDNDFIANCFLIGSYFLRSDTIQIARKKEIQQKTINFYIKAIENTEYKKRNIATINYLIGDLYRRIGDFDNAIKYYDIAINNRRRQKWLDDIIKAQKELALNKDENNLI